MIFSAADFILANPPFNLEWDVDKVSKDPRWRYGLAPKNNANYAWLQHMISKLSQNGKGYDKNKVMTTFVSAFPISNPQYALLVMMDSPKRSKETYGYNTAGWNSVPTAAEIIRKIAPQLNIQANYDLDEAINNKIIEASYGR